MGASLLALTSIAVNTPSMLNLQVQPEWDGLSTLWVLVAAFLVFFMQAGFGMLEAGLVRTKNAANVLTKNDQTTGQIKERSSVESARGGEDALCVGKGFGQPREHVGCRFDVRRQRRQRTLCEVVEHGAPADTAGAACEKVPVELRQVGQPICAQVNGQ